MPLIGEEYLTTARTVTESEEHPEEYLTTAQTVTESEEHPLENPTVGHLPPSREDETEDKTHLVTGYEERCYEDGTAFLSSSSS